MEQLEQAFVALSFGGKKGGNGVTDKMADNLLKQY